MKTALFTLFILVGPSIALCSGLPAIKAPKKFLECKTDTDCVVAGDGCRSCGELIIINRKFLKEFDELDQKLRRKHGVLGMACEACSTQRAQLKCVKKRCLQDQRRESNPAR